MSGFQYIILAYALYLIYSGISNKRKLKNPNPVFPDDEVNVLFTKIDKTLKLCSTICIFLGLLIAFVMFIDAVFDFKQLTIDCIKCIRIGNFSFWSAFIIFCLSVFLILLSGRSFGIAGNLSGLKEEIKAHYKCQNFRKMDDWIDDYNLENYLGNAETMKWNMKKFLLHYYDFMKPGLYIYYTSLLLFTLAYICGSTYMS
ncbi:MAG: hypothetical protein J6V99_03570 [Neisseriaceae bacterium]|nr:hypothetical protein [Neisseriaceae bacterium]